MLRLAGSNWVLLSGFCLAFGCAHDSTGEKTGAATNHESDAGEDEGFGADADVRDRDSGSRDVRDDAGGGESEGSNTDNEGGASHVEAGDGEEVVAIDAGDHGDGASDLDATVKPPSGPIVCETAFPDYDCDFSRTAFRQTFDTFLQDNCADCHSSFGGVQPELFVGEHDALLPYLDLDDVAASPLIEFIYVGHECWEPCDRAASEMQYLLEAWQGEFDLREQRLEELNDARERWAAAGIDDYEWSIENGCFSCLDDELYNVTAAVEDGSVVALRTGPYSEDPTNSHPPEDAFSWHVVGGMFDVVERIIERAPHYFDVSYNALGFVEHAQIDYHRDWFDEEDYYYSQGFNQLGAGFCEASGPFLPTEVEVEATRCSSTSDCDNCRNLEPARFLCGDLPRDCSADDDCDEGLECVWHDLQGLKGCYGYARYCAPTCEDSECPEGYGCNNGQCEELDCLEYPAACESEGDCQPRSWHADRRGCLLPSCEASGKDCGPLATCNPAAANAGPDGCAGIPCESDDDCGCGSCVNGSCNVAPGVCAP